jgi:predicted TIM-barrel fold metal-dependent hydrolase
MLIVDAQVHLWRTAPPSTQSHRQVATFTVDDLTAEMDAAGVDAALIHPPTSWDPRATDQAADAAQALPHRFGVMGYFNLKAPDREQLIANWKQRPGHVGLRYTFGLPETRAWLTAGTVDWLWPAAERACVPIAMPGAHIAMMDQVAKLHPNLKLIIDHFGLRRASPDAEGFSNVDQLVALAKHPNVALKATGAPAYSREAYPYRDIHPVLQRLYEAFGPQRYFWGTDITRMPCTYAECISMFTEDLPWLTGNDLELVMGRALCEWLGWRL